MTTDSESNICFTEPGTFSGLAIMSIANATDVDILLPSDSEAKPVEEALPSFLE